MAERRFTEDELRTYDGSDGRPAYVAYRGKVYDVSGSELWAGALHQRRHQPGRDLTAEFAAAPHDESMLERVPVMGTLVEGSPAASSPVLDLYLDLHLHPVSVHFPIALTLITALFLVLHLATDNRGLGESAYYVFTAGVIASPVAILAGVVSWWFNYKHVLTGIFRGKAALAVVLFGLQVATVVLWTWDREALIDREGVGWLYFAFVMVLVGVVLGLGWLGGRLVFPPRKKAR